MYVLKDNITLIGKVHALDHSSLENLKFIYSSEFDNVEIYGLISFINVLQYVYPQQYDSDL